MIAISLGRWDRTAGPRFVRERIYWRGRWTPFCKVQLRSKGPRTTIYLKKGLSWPESMDAAAGQYEQWGREWPDVGEFEYNAKTGVFIVTDDTPPAPPEREDDPDAG